MLSTVRLGHAAALALQQGAVVYQAAARARRCAHARQHPTLQRVLCHLQAGMRST